MHKHNQLNEELRGTTRMSDVEALADLSPNMRKVLRETDTTINRRDSYWITLVAMVQRGLLTKSGPQNYELTAVGRRYKAMLEGLDT